MNYEKLEASLITAGKNALIRWTDHDYHGEIIFTFDPSTNNYILDTELLRLDTVIKIIQAIK